MGHTSTGSYGKALYDYDEDYGQFKYLNRILNVSLLSKISSNNEEVKFNLIQYDSLGANPPVGDIYRYRYPYDRTLNPQEQLLYDYALTSVVVKNINGFKVKEWGFEYAQGDHRHSRYVLKKIQDITNNTNSISPYKFYYNDRYNAKTLKYPYFDFWGYPKDNFDPINIKEYHARFPSPNISEKGLLTGIHYPHGGYTQLEYEPNTYYFPESGDWYDYEWNSVLDDLNISDRSNLLGPGFRIKKIIKKTDNNITTTEYGYIDNLGKSSGRLTTYPIIKYPSNGSGTEFESFMYPINLDLGYVQYNKVIEYKGGKLENNKGKNGKIENYYSDVAPEENDYNNLPYNLKVFEEEKNGLLEKKIIYDKNNNILKEKSYNYTIRQSQNFFRGLKVDTESGYFDSDLWGAYKVYGYISYLANVLEKSYDQNNQNVFNEKNTNLEYSRNNVDYLNPVKITKSRSNGDTIDTELYYPKDFEGG